MFCNVEHRNRKLHDTRQRLVASCVKYQNWLCSIEPKWNSLEPYSYVSIEILLLFCVRTFVHCVYTVRIHSVNCFDSTNNNLRNIHIYAVSIEIYDFIRNISGKLCNSKIPQTYSTFIRHSCFPTDQNNSIENGL